MILDEIVERKKVQLGVEMAGMTIEEWENKTKRPGLHKPLNFFGAIKRKEEISIIAEIKKASPSKGLIRDNFDPADLARQYFGAGVQAISVLTEKYFFQGCDEYLVKVRQTVPVPILRKDFLVDLRQVYQSRCMGADAILLIVSILSDEMLKKMLSVSDTLGLQCLVETHDEEEVERAVAAGAKIIGINNRDLKTFKVDLGVTGRLISRIPRDRAVVSESGIKTAGDINCLKGLGADAVLIGEAFMASPSIKDKIDELKENG